MKLITEFLNNDTLKITTDDDPDNFYQLVWKTESKTRMYSLWYNDDFVWEKYYSTTGEALGNVIAALTDAMTKIAVSE